MGVLSNVLKIDSLYNIKIIAVNLRLKAGDSVIPFFIDQAYPSSASRSSSMPRK